jgi:Protein of unknown function (DUF3800)
VYLAYLDDSDTKDKADKWQVMAAVIIPDYLFNVSELMLSFVIQSLIPEDKLDNFEEFHASELFGGYGVFEDIDQSKRFEAIESLLTVICTSQMHIAYGAVDLEFLRNQDYRSANAQDMAFRSCVKGIQNWMSELAMENLKKSDIAAGQAWESPLALLIADDGNKKNNAEMQKSFRELRKRLRVPKNFGFDSAHFHDDMYFGDSKFSLGIQLADLCAFFIAKHLEKRADAEGFYQMISSRIVFSKTHPELS